MRASASHILCPTEADCLAVKAEIEGGKSFADAAREHSGCPSSASGGELGTFGKGQMVREFEEVVFSGPVGEVLGPVKTDFGYHLILITQRG